MLFVWFSNTYGPLSAGESGDRGEQRGLDGQGRLLPGLRAAAEPFRPRAVHCDDDLCAVVAKNGPKTAENR